MDGVVAKAVSLTAEPRYVVAVALHMTCGQPRPYAFAHVGKVDVGIKRRRVAVAERHPPAALLRQRVQVDHSSSGVAAPDRALRPGQELHTGNPSKVQRAEIKGRADARIVHREAVHADEQMVRLGAPHSRLG